MAWERRVKQAAYISPLGFRTVFNFEDVSKEFDKKTIAFDFPAANGTYVQDLGRSGRRYPMRAIFWGDNYDREALAFEAQLRERGIGRLEHPIYGTVNVIPFGTIVRRDGLKTQANQAVIEVTFWETIWEIYAGAITDLLDKVFGAIDFYNAAASGQLNFEIVLDTIVESTAFKGFYNRLVSGVVSQLGGMVSGSPAVAGQFGAVARSMQSDLQSAEIPIVDALGAQTNILIQLPAKAAAVGIKTRLDTYDTFLNSLTVDSTIMQAGFDARKDNNFHSRDIYAAGCVSGMVASVLNNIFSFKPEAISAAEAILTAFDTWTIWREKNYEILKKDDVGGAYAALQEAVALAAGYLIEISFALQTEKIITLTRARGLVELAGELYGEIDAKLDFFIKTNELTGSEILEIPRGRRIVYYI